MNNFFCDRDDSIGRRRWCIGLGGLAAAAAVGLSSAPDKFLAAGLAGVGLLVVCLALGSRYRAGLLLVALYGLSIPFFLDVHFLPRAHLGGAVGVSISVSFLLLLALVLVCRPAPDRLRINRVLLLPPLLFMLWGVVSMVNAPDMQLSLFELLRLATLVILLAGIMNLRRPGYVDVLLGVLAAGVIIEFVFAVLQYRSGRSLGLELFGESATVRQYLGFMAHRTTGTLGHPNILAYYFELLAPLFLALAIAEQGGRRMLYAIATVCALLGMLTTLSRGAWITVPVSLPLVCLVMYRGRFLRTRTMLAGGAIAVIAVLLFGGMYPTIKKRLVYDDYRAAAQRLPLNSAAMSIIRQYPVAGVGLNNGAGVFKQYDTTGRSRVWKHSGHVVHNMYLAVAVDTGLPGLAAFVSIFGAAFWVVWRCVRRVALRQRAVLIGAAAGLLAHMIHGLVDAGFLTAMNVSTLVFSLIGLIGAVSLQSSEPDSGPPLHSA